MRPRDSFHSYFRPLALYGWWWESQEVTSSLSTTWEKQSLVRRPAQEPPDTDVHEYATGNYSVSPKTPPCTKLGEGEIGKKQPKEGRGTLSGCAGLDGCASLEDWQASAAKTVAEPITASRGRWSCAWSGLPSRSLPESSAPHHEYAASASAAASVVLVSASEGVSHWP